MKEKRTTGFAIAIAWPATWCKQPGSWYDSLTRWMGINRNDYYRAGHAALVLVDAIRKECHYFDFGRYHSPFGMGRVRNASSDHGLAIRTVPKISPEGRSLLNFEEILRELQQNPSCHGEGVLYGSYVPAFFLPAYKKAIELQQQSPIPYGPFLSGGSNCSRFVNTILRAGQPGWQHMLRLKYFVPFTPTPRNNVNALKRKQRLPSSLSQAPSYPAFRHTQHFLLHTLPAPARHPDIPVEAQWLAGEGVGSWFYPEVMGAYVKCSLYSPEGKTECSGWYKNQEGFLLHPGTKPELTYLSHCQFLTLRINKHEVRYERLNYVPEEAGYMRSVRNNLVLNDVTSQSSHHLSNTWV